MTKYEFLVGEIERLREHPTEECVEWPFSRGKPGGYGQLVHRYKRYATHRLAFELFHGHKPMNLVCHHCGNKPCYNPDHLYDGTQAENLADARCLLGDRSRERGAAEDNEYTQTERYALLSWWLADGDKLTSEQIARRFGVRRNVARMMFATISRKLPIFRDERGRWQKVMKTH